MLKINKGQLIFGAIINLYGILLYNYTGEHSPHSGSGNQSGRVLKEGVYTFLLITSICLIIFGVVNIVYGFSGYYNQSDIKKCPECADLIKLEAKLCKHWGHKFSEEKSKKEII